MYDDDRLSNVRRILQRIAKAGKPIPYSHLMRKVGLDPNAAEHRMEFDVYLRDIGKREVCEGRPLITALAIVLREGRAGHGFFDLSRELGLQIDELDDVFWRAEVARVYDYWRTRHLAIVNGSVS